MYTHTSQANFSQKVKKKIDRKYRSCLFFPPHLGVGEWIEKKARGGIKYLRGGKGKVMNRLKTRVLKNGCGFVRVDVFGQLAQSQQMIIHALA
jgi:hypothetical protein